MTTVVLFEDEHFRGSSLVLQGDDRDLRNNFHLDGFVPDNWNDETSSLVVAGGSARFHRDINFGGPAVTLSEGVYDLNELQALGIRNDWISSVDLF